MRRIAAAQVVTMVAGLVLGNSTSAEETFPTLPTVSVTGQYNTVTVFGWSSNNIRLSSGSAPSNLGNNAVYRSEEHKRALDCAKAYTTTGPGANKGPKPGTSTWMTNNYGWFRPSGSSNEIRSMTTNTPPDSDPAWRSAAGITIGKIVTFVFTPNNPTQTSMIESLSHEWAHQWGASDLYDGSAMDADAIGKKAVADYLADNGAKCGGL